MQFWKPNNSNSTWLVSMFDAWYEMSDNALEPNGVNMYAGDDSGIDRGWISGHMDCVDNIRMVPGQIVRAALLRAQDHEGYYNEKG